MYILYYYIVCACGPKVEWPYAMRLGCTAAENEGEPCLVPMNTLYILERKPIYVYVCVCVSVRARAFSLFHDKCL